MPADVQEQLVKYLTDVHSIERQAIAQLRRAPGLAGDPVLSSVFEQHLEETESQERRVRERLEAHDADSSLAKDLAGHLGGLGMMMFARFNPDTPGKLVSHAFSYEHMELAAYQLLSRVAERAGDFHTAAVAREIAEEEREMAWRLEANFDRAVDASLREQDPDHLSEQLNSYLADAHAIESQAISLLEGGREIVGEGEIARIFDQHLEETHRQQERLAECLEARGSSSSRIKDIGMRLGGFNVGAFFAAQPDTPAKLTGFAYAFEHLEIAAYEQLSRVAERAEAPDVVQLADGTAAEERAMAGRIADRWDEAVEAALEEQGVA